MNFENLKTESYKKISAEYLQWLSTLGFSKGIEYNYTNRVADFFYWLESKNILSVTAITQKHISEYFAYLEQKTGVRTRKPFSTSHLNHNFAAIDYLLEFLHQHGAKNTPIPTQHRIKPDKQARIHKIKPFTQAEIKILYNGIENTYPQLQYILREAKHYQLKLIFTLYYGCGLRRHEGYKLRIDDIDFDKKTVFIEKGKNYKDRIIPMSAGVYKELQDYIYNFRHRLKLPHKRLFIYEENALSNCLKELHRICTDENIKAKKITLHILRHSIATHLLQNGMTIENIALFLGHSTLESTQIYTHFI